MNEHDDILKTLGDVKSLLALLVLQTAGKKYFSVTEVALLVGRSAYTVRDWCRTGRLRADKKLAGRGKGAGWVVSRLEIERFQSDGLLPSTLCHSALGILH